ncbi:MAG: magnesium transporter [Limisphaerales bacterium]
MENRPVILSEFLHLHPADLADRLQRLPMAEAVRILPQLPPALGAATLAELDMERQSELVEALSVEDLGPLLAALPARLVADLVPALSPARRRPILEALPAENQRRVHALLSHAPDSAGGIMSDRFIVLAQDQPVSEALESLRERTQPAPEEVSYLYVTDDSRRLVGVVPLRELVFRRPDRKIGEVMRREVKFLKVDADQEEIARQFEHYHFLALPVLDADGRLVGIVHANDALAIAQDEATEDMQLMVGLSGEERTSTPWRTSIKRRLPWLFINLATAFLAAAVVAFFESTIARWTALAVFLPIIAGQGGNSGMQTITVIIRDMALGELSPGDGKRALAKEAILGLLNGLAVGAVVGLAAYAWKGSLVLAGVAMAAMVLNALAAAVAGVAIPFGLRMVRVDPALASSIFVTTVTDVAGFFFFLGLGLLALRWTGL